MSYGIKLQVWGDLACFTRPEMKVERVSYDVITPSAARGIVEAIYWKPAICWIIDKIHVLNPIQFMNLRRNELAGKMSYRNIKTAMKDKTTPLQKFIENERQQRAAMVLKDVSYIIEAHFDYINQDDNNDGKHLDTFRRRAEKGKCFMQPYLGCREFPAHFRLLDENDAAPSSYYSGQGQKDLGFMLHDIDFENDMQPRFFRAKMVDGIITVPPFKSEEVRK